MALPLFYLKDLSADKLTLNEDVSKHIISVLRKEKGAEILLTDGKGTKATATIVDDNRKRCSVEVSSREMVEESLIKVSIAISIVKNASRFEWFLEKATEIGVNEIIPLLCERTEKEKFRYERMETIIVSAMLQSQQSWLPVLHQPTTFSDVVKQTNLSQKFIAHCMEDKKQQLAQVVKPQSSLTLIGPEGDFTAAEIDLALASNFLPVALGATRLRTETAGIVAATLLRQYQ